MSVARTGSTGRTIVRSLDPLEHARLVGALLAERPDLAELVENLTADLLEPFLEDVERRWRVGFEEEVVERTTEWERWR